MAVLPSSDWFRRLLTGWFECVLRGEAEAVLQFGKAERLLKKLTGSGGACSVFDRVQIVPGGNDNVDIRAFFGSPRREFKCDTIGQFVVEKDVPDLVLVECPDGFRLGKIRGEVLFLETERQEGGVQIEQERLAIFDNQNSIARTREIRGEAVATVF